MKVGRGENLGLSREYPKKLFGPIIYSWWNCPLKVEDKPKYGKLGVVILGAFSF